MNLQAAADSGIQIKVLIKMFLMCRFLVPINDSGAGYCGATIIKLYFDCLNEDLKRNITEGPVFYRGSKPGPKVKVSKFVKTPIGKVTLSETGKEVARFLNLPNPDKYTGHCFR